MGNTGVDEAQAGLKIAVRNINNLRYADDTTFCFLPLKELKSLLMKVKEESEKVGLKKPSKNLNHGIWPHLFMANRWENNGNSDSLFLGSGRGSKITADFDCSHEIKRHLLPGRRAMTNLGSILKRRDIC